MELQKLLSKATILSDQIIQQGYKPEDRIGVCMPKRSRANHWQRSGYFINGELMFRLDVLQPEERINRIAKNAQLSLLIVSDSDPSYSIYATFCNRIVWQKSSTSENKTTTQYRYISSSSSLCYLYFQVLLESLKVLLYPMPAQWIPALISIPAI